MKQGGTPGSYGHSFIFIRCVRDGAGTITGLKIADQGFQAGDVLKESDYGFWVGANILITGRPVYVKPRKSREGF